MSIYYKFNSSIAYDVITIKGPHISVANLKTLIAHQKRLNTLSECNLLISNPHTGEVYKEDSELIPKNTSVIVKRVPIKEPVITSTNKRDRRNPTKSESTDLPPEITTRLLCNGESEEDKIKTMMAQSAQLYDWSNFPKKQEQRERGPVPRNYVCHKCGFAGHWINHCPLNQAVGIKKSTGIPLSFMVPVDGPQVPGAKITPFGHFAVSAIDQEGYRQPKIEKYPFGTESPAVEEPKPIVPRELVCSLCKSLFSEAVVIPCCGFPFCDDCIRTLLLESEEQECPHCHTAPVSPDSLTPNRFLRTVVNDFQRQEGSYKTQSSGSSCSTALQFLPNIGTQAQLKLEKSH